MSFSRDHEFRAAIEAGDRARALIILSSAIAEAPEKVGPHVLRASLLSEDGHFSEALADLRAAEAMGLEPESKDEEFVSCGIYHCLLDLGDLDGAILEAQRYFATPPTQRSPLYYQSYQDIIALRSLHSDEFVREAVNSLRRN